MIDLIGEIAQNLQLGSRSAYEQSHPRPFFHRVRTKNQRGRPKPLSEEWGGLALAIPNHILRTVADLAYSGRRPMKLLPSSAHALLGYLRYPGAQPRFNLGDPSNLALVLLVHSISAVSDVIFLAAEIGRGWRTSMGLGEDLPTEVLLSCQRWQEENRGVLQASALKLRLDGRLLTPAIMRARLDESRRRRELLYGSLAVGVVPTDPGETIDVAALDAMVRHFAGLSSELADKELSPARRGQPDVMFMRHLANTTGRTSSVMPVLSEGYIRYYLIQTLAQAPYLRRAAKVASNSERSFDDCHKHELTPQRWCDHWPMSTSGFLPTIHDQPHELGSGSVLAYNGLSGSVIKSAQPGSDLSGPLRQFIPLDQTDQPVEEIAAILKGTSTLHVNRLVADLASFLLLCQRKQPDILAEACRAANLPGGMEELLYQLGGDQLMEGWQEASVLEGGRATRDSWADSFDSLNPASTSRPKGMSPHLWLSLQSRWSDKSYQLLAMMMVVVRNYYLAVTARH